MKQSRWPKNVIETLPVIAPGPKDNYSHYRPSLPAIYLLTFSTYVRGHFIHSPTDFLLRPNLLGIAPPANPLRLMLLELCPHLAVGCPFCSTCTVCLARELPFLGRSITSEKLDYEPIKPSLVNLVLVPITRPPSRRPSS